MRQLVLSLVDREQATHAEQQDRDDKAPEVTQLAVAKRMLLEPVTMAAQVLAIAIPKFARKA
jgi:hypothetical protein